jgi:hypothetical protein
MGLLLAFGRDATPYPFRFEPLLAEGAATLIPPDGGGFEGPEDPLSGRLLRCNFGLNPISRFYGTRAFGMDAGVPRTEAHVPFTGAGVLGISTNFIYDFRLFVTHDIFSFFLYCDATLRIYVEEFDPSFNFIRATVPVQLNVVSSLTNGFLSTSVTHNRAGNRIINGSVNTLPGHFYRIWTDVQIALTVHGAGIVRFNVGNPFVLCGFTAR